MTNFKIDNNEVNDQFLDIIKDLSGNDINNFVRNRLVINQLINAYEG